MTPPTLSAPTQPKLFISYAHSDSRLAERIVAALADRGVTTWRPDELSAGDSVTGSIGDAIRRSDAVAVLLSREAAKSPWVNREIAFALADDSGEGPKRVIPVLLEPDVELPPFLRDLRYIDLSSQAHFGQGLDELVAAAAVEPRVRKDQERELQLRRRMLNAERVALLEAQRQMYEEYSRQSAKLGRTLTVLAIVVTLATGVGLMIGGFGNGRILGNIGAGVLGLAIGAVLGYRRGMTR